MDSKQTKNFSEHDKLILLDTCEQFLNVIANKKTDATSVKQKKETWEKITTLFNSNSLSGPRTTKQLHFLYDTLKRKAREYISNDKVEHYKTDDGTHVPQTSSVDEKLVAMLQPQFQPLCNPHNSSADYLGDVSTVKVISFMEDVQEAEEELIASTTTPLPAKKKMPITKRTRAVEDMAERVMRMKNVKDMYDKEVHEQRMKILYIEEDIKGKERYNLMKMNELELEIKRKQLDHINAENEIKALELNIKICQFRQLSSVNK